jgi:predicted porin
VTTQNLICIAKDPIAREGRGRGRLQAACLLAILSAATGIAAAQTSAPAQTTITTGAPDQSLTWHGITLYGIVDLGLQYETHGAPFGDYHPASSENLVNKNSRQSVTGATSNNLSQSRVGLQGTEPMGGDWSAVFKLETFFNPSTGQISDALHDMTINNGRPLNQQITNLDSSVAGQPFQTAYAGVSSKTFGTLTFGRQVTLLGDGVTKFDPNLGSQAFSLIGMSGTYAGGGDTEDKRVDDSLKYLVNFADIGRFGLFYKFNGSHGAANTGYQADLGADFAGFSADVYYSKFNSAVSASSLSVAQVEGLPTQGVADGLPANYFSVSNSLAATISDNTVYALLGSYKFDVFKFYAGYEHIQYSNPTNPLSPAPLNGVGSTTIGGYQLAYVNNSAFPSDKVLQVYWAGVRWTVMPGLDLVGAYYGYHQNSYGAGANAGCDTNKAGTCSGHLEAFSIDAVYAFSKRFDGYAGAMYSAVYDGVANGYLYQRNNINPTIGVRFKF